jgi:hypothetical protein
VTDKRAGAGNAPAARKRGAGFPVVSLPDAVKVIQEAGAYGREHSMNAFAGYMGHKTTNSGAFKSKFAAFRDWKLVTVSGDRVALSDLGRRIALPTTPESHAEDLRTAFFNCAIFAETYQSSAKGRVLDLSALANGAVHNQGVSAVSRMEFAESLADSASAAGLAETAGEGKIRFLAEPRSGDELAEDDLQERDAIAPMPIVTPPAATPPASQPVPVVLRQVLPIAAGEVILEIRSHRPLPATAYGQIGTVAKELEGLASLLAPEGEPIATE